MCPKFCPKFCPNFICVRKLHIEHRHRFTFWHLLYSAARSSFSQHFRLFITFEDLCSLSNHFRTTAGFTSWSGPPANATGNLPKTEESVLSKKGRRGPFFERCYSVKCAAIFDWIRQKRVRERVHSQHSLHLANMGHQFSKCLHFANTYFLESRITKSLDKAYKKWIFAWINFRGR